MRLIHQTITVQSGVQNTMGISPQDFYRAMTCTEYPTALLHAV